MVYIVQWPIDGPTLDVMHTAPTQIHTHREIVFEKPSKPNTIIKGSRGRRGQKKERAQANRSEYPVCSVLVCCLMRKRVEYSCINNFFSFKLKFPINLHVAQMSIVPRLIKTKSVIL